MINKSDVSQETNVQYLVGPLLAEGQVLPLPNVLAEMAGYIVNLSYVKLC